MYLGIQYLRGYGQKRSFLAVAQKIFSCNGVRKNLFLQDVKKDIFFGGDEGVSNFKKIQTINKTSSITKSPSSTTKAAAPMKKKR